MDSILRTIGKTVSAVFEAVVTKPIRRRGVLWTIAAWLAVGSTVSLIDALGRAGLLGLALLWGLCMFLFLKLHMGKKRQARELPYRRR